MKRPKFRERKDKTKTRKTLRKAFYQYVLDHSYPTPKGLVVNFYLPQEDDFYRKVEAREYLDYIRVQKEEHFDEYNRWLANYNKLKKAEDYNKMMSRKGDKLRKNGSLYIKILFFLKKVISKQINAKMEKIGNDILINTKN